MFHGVGLYRKVLGAPARMHGDVDGDYAAVVIRMATPTTLRR
jgi:hypothetical protein